MFTKIRFALCALALSVPGVTFLRAGAPPLEPRTGHVLLLDNDRIMEGDIERVGDQYRIRRSIGETWMAADKVQCLCASVEEVYLFLRGRANADDPDEHLQLAHWCQQRGLRAQALAEATAAVELRPNHAEAKRYLTGLQRLDANAPAATVAHEEAEPDLGPVPTVDFNAESLGMFVTRVQPVLMNACVSCHVGNRGGAFRLTRTYEGDLNNRRATQQNLAAVLGQVNQSRPRESLLLTRAVTVHGGDSDQPPIKSRQAPAYRILEDWVQWALRTPTHEVVSSPIEPRISADPVVSKPAAAAAPPAQPAQTSAPAAATQPTAQPPALSQAEAAANQPPAAAGPADPFDPSIFNQQLHPESNRK